MEFRNLKAQYESLKNEIDVNIQKVMSEGQFILGHQVQDLEKKLADFVGVKNCVCCANGTDAITLLLMAWGIGPGDAVFVPDITFIASAGAAAILGATPVFVDIDLKTYNMDCESLLNAIDIVKKDGRLKPRVIIAVDLFGLPANYEKISEIAAKKNLLVLEDGAQSFGGSFNNKRSCSFGNGAATSFFPAKPLGCYGDGGAIFTNDDGVKEKIISLRAQGRSSSDKYDNYQIGINSRLDTLQAAILQVKLDALIKVELKRVNEVALKYTEMLSSLKNRIALPCIPQNYYSAWAQYTILLENESVRNALKVYLEKHGIPTMIYYPKPMHKQTAFKDCIFKNEKLINSVKMAKTTLSLPISPYLTEEEQNEVVGRIKEFFKNN